MYFLQLPQLIQSKHLTGCLLVYALVPRILTENVTPIDDICNFTYPLHYGQPFMDDGVNINEVVHEVPLYIYICYNYICFTQLLQLMPLLHYYHSITHIPLLL
jgi:hypothetical protein